SQQQIEQDVGQIPEEAILAAQETNQLSQLATEEAAIAVEQPSEFYSSEVEYAWPAAEGSPDFSVEPTGNDQPHEAIFAEGEAFAQSEVFIQAEAPVVEATANPISDF